VKRLNESGNERRFTFYLCAISHQRSALTGCGKTIVPRWIIDGVHVEGNRRTAGRMLKKAVQQGRSERRGEGVHFGTLSF
jgi:hypothetical protein